MLGGDEAPCISLDSIRVLQQQGVICPRVELDPESRAAAELAIAATRIGADSPLWRLIFDAESEGMDTRAKVGLLYRVLNAVGHPEIAARVERLRAKAAEERSK